jgi:hypothetical protein
MTELPPSDGPGPVSPSGRRAFFLFLLVLVAVYLPLFFGRIIFTRDIAHWIFPARWFVRASLLAGELPLWNPYQGLGFPVLGDPLYGVFYPPNWLLLLTGPGWFAWALSALDFFHMALGGAGVFVLARRLRATPIAAGIAALAWSLSGYMTAQWTAGLRLHAGAWIPWAAVGHLALLTSLRMAGRRWMSGIVKAAAPTALALLMGEMFLAVMGMGLAAALLLAVQVTEQHQGAPRFRIRWALAHVLAVGLAVGVAAVAIVPARAAMASSARATALSRDDAEVSSLHPLRIVEFAAPGCMGDVYGDYPAAHVVGEPRLDGLPLSYSVYLGASVIALALIAFRRRFLFIALGCFTGFALLVSLGKFLPLHAVVRRLVPPLAFMRFPEKYLTLVVVGLALLAGLGAQRLLLGKAQPWRRTVVFLAVLVALGVASLALFSYPWSGYMMHGLRHGAVATLALLLVQVLAARGSRMAAPMLATTVALDLSLVVLGLQNFVPATIATTTPDSVRVVQADYGVHSVPPRIYRSPATDTALAHRSKVSNAAEGELRLLATLIPSTVNVWGIATLPGYDAAIPASMNRLWDEGKGARLASLRLLSADYAVLPVGDVHDAAKHHAGIRPLSDPVPGARIYRVAESLPRVFLAGQTWILSDDETLRHLFDPAVVAGETACIAADAQAKSLADQPGRAGNCLIETFAPRRIQARCQATRAGLAVFVEQFDRGWHAKVDGIAAPLLRTNLVMRGVPIEPGEHQIALEYQAPGLRTGWAITAAALAILLALAIAAWAGRARPASPNTAG